MFSLSFTRKLYANKMLPKKMTGNKFVWSDNEAELLLNMANEQKVSKQPKVSIGSGFLSPHLLFSQTLPGKIHFKRLCFISCVFKSVHFGQLFQTETVFVCFHHSHVNKTCIHKEKFVFSVKNVLCKCSLIYLPRKWPILPALCQILLAD